MKKHLNLFYFLPFIFSCTYQQDENGTNTFAPKVTEAKGRIISADRLSKPLIIRVAENKLKINAVGKPEVVAVNTNIHEAGNPFIVISGKPRVVTPGQDTFLKPKTFPAIYQRIIAGLPEAVLVKDPNLKVQNPQNFISFDTLQDLNNEDINCMIEDKSGNIWFGTNGGGVSKYDGKYFTHFTEKEGLISNYVLELLEDRNGNLWFGSNGGVSKYDGKYFTNFKLIESFNKNHFSYIKSMLEDKSGNLWFGTYTGLWKYDGKEFTLFTEKEGLSNKEVLCILQDKDGNLWFGTAGGGVCKYDGKLFTHFTEKEGLRNNVAYRTWDKKNVVSNILEDKNGNLWFSIHGGVSKYDGKSFSNFTVKEGLSNDFVRSMLEDKSGNIWFGGENGVSKFDGKYFTNYTENEGLSSNLVRGILQDRHGNIWICTWRGGVCRFDGNNFTQITTNEGLSNNDAYAQLENKNVNGLKGALSGLNLNYTVKASIGNNRVLAILEDHSGVLWFGTQGGGVSKYDGNSFTHFTEKEGLSNNYIYSIAEDKKGNLWFGTGGGGACKFDGKSFTNFTEKDGLSNNTIYCIIEDKNRNIWFGTGGGGVCKYDGERLTNFTEKQGLSNNIVLTIIEDNTGNLWFGTSGGGISKYDGKIFTNFTTKEGLISNMVLCVLQDKKGNMWFGSDSSGVSKYDGRQFTNYTKKEGLGSNNVLSIVEDKAGNLWFGTSMGLSRLNKNKLAEMSDKSISNNHSDIYFTNYSFDEGFLGTGCIRNSIYESKNGVIWIGTNDRLTAYHPAGGISDTIAPTIQLTSINLYNENISWTSLENKDTSFILGNGILIKNFRFDEISKWNAVPVNLSLAYYNNYVTFNYIGITQKYPKKVKYKYKLEGYNENWSGLTTQTQTHPYGNLSPGNYVFKIKAMNSEGYWSKELNYSLTIRPPWWKTWWAYSFYFFIVTGSIWYYIKWREKALKDRQKELERTVTERTAEVIAQKERSEELLLNILPSEVAEELKRKGSAEAKQFDEATVMFTDFKGFTYISEKLSPSELVAEIDTCFKAFDNIIGKHNIEKIKTIGDSYMCAGGLPVENKTNATDVVRAALEIQQFMKEHQKQRIEEGKEVFEIRIGVNTGPVVAGIVGVKKFAYDIWGDTVNIASRMESSGEAGKVNISGSTYELIKDKFTCTHRGKIEAKNKGMIEMYFVESEIL